MLNLTNHFLVAMPSLNSDMFSSSVVYVTEHTVDSGAVGVIINKPLGKTLKNAFKGVDFGEYHPKWSDSSLYLGGPISNDNGCVLHRKRDDSDKLFELTNNRNVLKDIAKTDSRLGDSHWNVPGPDGSRGFGGACFPKDSSALLNLSNQLNIDMNMLDTSLIKNKKYKRITAI